MRLVSGNNASASQQQGPLVSQQRPQKGTRNMLRSAVTLNEAGGRMQEQRLIDVIMSLQSSSMLSLTGKIPCVGASEMRSSFQRSLRRANRDSPICTGKIPSCNDAVPTTRRETRTRSEDPNVQRNPEP